MRLVAGHGKTAETKSLWFGCQTGVGECEAVYNNRGFWHFHFNGPTPETSEQGRERIYFEHFWNDFAADKTRSIAQT